MKFDCVIGNPPYQDSENQRSPLWEKFVEKSFELCKDDGHISLIHPSAWRKPIHKLFPLFQENDLKYLEIHNQKDGQKTFGAGTRYDWYVVKKSPNRGRSVIVDEDGEKVICNLAEMGCIPHKNLELFESMLAHKGDRKCEVMYSRSAYASDKAWTSFDKGGEFVYPVVHATKASGPRIIYSSTSKNGHFGVKKVIMGMASPERGFYDEGGNFGISQNVFSIVVNNNKDGEELENFIKTNNFKTLSSLFQWSGFAVDYRVFRMLRKDFWRDFI